MLTPDAADALEERPGPWIVTVTGVRFHLTEPRAQDVRFGDIAHALSRIMRFGGHTMAPYTVAQHSVLVSCLVPEELALHGLFHDAHEAYVGDLVSPLKRELSVHTSEWITWEAGLDRAIYERFGLRRLDRMEREQLKTADLEALAIEVRDLFTDKQREHAFPVLEGVKLREDARLTGGASAFASPEHQFAQRYLDLCDQRG